MSWGVKEIAHQPSLSSWTPYLAIVDMTTNVDEGVSDTCDTGQPPVGFLLTNSRLITASLHL